MSWFAIIAPAYIAVGVALVIRDWQRPGFPPGAESLPRGILIATTVLYVASTVVIWPMDIVQWLRKRCKK
jgi:hypothetical protein